jgi:hypothetical protein
MRTQVSATTAPKHNETQQTDIQHAKVGYSSLPLKPAPPPELIRNSIPKRNSREPESATASAPPQAIHFQTLSGKSSTQVQQPARPPGANSIQASRKAAAAASGTTGENSLKSAS